MLCSACECLCVHESVCVHVRVSLSVCVSVYHVYYVFV